MPDSVQASTRCGTVALAGRPNVGKSTLLNRLVGEPLAIVSRKPQTTRQAVIGIRTDEHIQLIFVDLPGLLEPSYLMQHSMLDEAVAALRRADAVLYLHPLDEGTPPPLTDVLPDAGILRAPCRTVLTKIDLVPAERREALAEDGLPVSAHSGEGLDALLAWCRSQVPPGPFRHDPEDLSTQPLRFFAAEFAREAAFHHLGAELPYALAAETDEFREGSEPLYIRVILYVERESQKGMVIGKRGRTIKAIGSDTRARLEAFLGTPVYLDLWVKTLAKWRSDAKALRRFGFSVPGTKGQ